MDEKRIDAANAVLALICGGDKSVRLEFTGKRAFVSWLEWSTKKRVRVQWVTHKGNDFYPTWHRRRGPWGGTCSTAMALLIRWCQGKPVLPLSTWRYWATPTVRLGGDHGAEMVKMLSDAGYPVSADCVCCGLPPIGMDWYSHDGKSGPCCRGPICVHRPEEAARIREERKALVLT